MPVRIVFALSGLLAAVPVAHGAERTLDLLVRDARIVDGTGNPWYRGDVAVDDGLIVAIGDDLDVRAARTIDAAERVLAPGFIDVHTHVESSRSRAGLMKLPRAENFVRDGVTTIVTGNCGGSAVDVGEWRDELAGLGINVATLIGHNSVRRRVMGRDDRAPTPAEMAEMEALVEQAMQDGAVGLSTGLLYVPGAYAETDEVIRLAAVAARYGGVYATHLREQGVQLHESIDEAVRIGVEAGLPVQISHFKVKGRTRWGTAADAIARVERYRADGVDVVVDAYPYNRSSTNLGVMLPRWAFAGGRRKLLERLEDGETRQRIAAEMKEMVEEGGYPDYSFATVAMFRPDPSLNGKTISEINVAAGRAATLGDEIETILELMTEGARDGRSGGAQMVYHIMSTDDVDTIFRYPNTAVASDGNINTFGKGVPHPRSYGTNARVLARFVREQRVLSLEDAIRRMTSLPARTFRFTDRGQIRAGFRADLVLFDPERVDDKATFREPHRYSEGFDVVIVNGGVVVVDGKMTDETPGRFIDLQELRGHELVGRHQWERRPAAIQ